MKKLIIFDLGGTLLNTTVDLAHSANCASDRLGHPTHDVEKYNFMIGNGINKLFERALPEGEKTEEDALRVRKGFTPYYDIHNADDSRPYPGIPVLLSCLQSAGIQVTVTSSKYQAATEELVAHCFSEIHFTAVFDRREGINVKPDPTIASDILKLADVRKEGVLYVNDSGVDMQTAANVGVTACGATWGFQPRAELGEFNPAYMTDVTERIKKMVF